MSEITRERSEELARQILPVDLNPWTVDIDTARGLRRLLQEERRRVAEEIAQALEEMTPLWMANTASMGDGIDQRRAVQVARQIGGVS